jgi:hypothetical protein
MAFFDWGNQPIFSTGFAPIVAGSTTALFAELDSTQLGTKDYAVGQKGVAQVTWIVGADTNVTWQCEVATSTALNAGVNVFFPKTITAQSAQYVTKHELFKDYRIRVRQQSSGANGAASIIAEFQT